MTGYDSSLLLVQLVAVLAMLMCVARRYSTRVHLYAAQSALLIVAQPTALPELIRHPTFVVFALLTAIVKCGLLPRQMGALRRRHPTRREPARGWSRLLVAGVVLGAAQQAATASLPAASAGNIAAAITTVLLGAYICSRSAEPLTQLLGLVVAENGVALAIVTAAPWSWLSFVALLGFELGIAAIVLTLNRPAIATALLVDPSSRIGGRP